MIIGVGNDLCDIRRIETPLARFGERFVLRCFTETERRKSAARAGRAASYAKRFAAKKACAKPLGTGLRAGVGWREKGVVNLQSGKPDVIPRKRAEATQNAFIASDENRLNSLADNEAVLVADAGHPTHGLAARQLLGAGPRKARDPANERAPAHQHSRRDRSLSRMTEVETVDAAAPIRLLESIAAHYCVRVRILVFLACFSHQRALDHDRYKMNHALASAPDHSP